MTNLAAYAGKCRQNSNTRLPMLADYSLVGKTGPKERSGLYGITPREKLIALEIVELAERTMQSISWCVVWIHWMRLDRSRRRQTEHDSKGGRFR